MPVVLRVKLMHCAAVLLKIGGLCCVVVVVSVFVAVHLCGSGRLMSKCISWDSGVDYGGCGGRSGVSGVVYLWAGQ